MEDKDADISNIPSASARAKLFYNLLEEEEKITLV